MRDSHTHPVSLTACTVCCYQYLHGSITGTSAIFPTSSECFAGAAAADDAAAAGSGAAGGNGTSTSSASFVPIVHCIPTIVPNSRHAPVFLVQQVEPAAVDICMAVPLERLQSFLSLNICLRGLQALLPPMTLQRQAAAQLAATAQALPVRCLSQQPAPDEARTHEPALSDVAEIRRMSAAVAIVTPLMPENTFGCSAGAAAADDAAAAGSGAAGGDGTSSSAWSRPMLLLFENLVHQCLCTMTLQTRFDLQGDPRQTTLS